MQPTTSQVDLEFFNMSITCKTHNGIKERNKSFLFRNNQI